MRKSTTLQFRGAGAQRLSWALAGNFVKRQKHTRGAARRVAQALNEHGTKAWAWLMTQLYSRVQAHHNNRPFHNRESRMKKSH